MDQGCTEGHAGSNPNPRSRLPALLSALDNLHSLLALLCRQSLLASIGNALKIPENLPHIAIALPSIEVETPLNNKPPLFLLSGWRYSLPLGYPSPLKPLCHAFTISLYSSSPLLTRARRDVFKAIVAARENTSKQAVGKRAKRIHIPAVAGALKIPIRVQELLRRSIEQGVSVSELLKTRHQTLCVIRQQNAIVRIQKNISRLEISVSNPAPMKIRKNLRQSTNEHP